MKGEDRDDLIRLAHAWDRAMVENDPEAIGRFMSEDWTIIGSDGSIGDRATFLRLIESGDLTHNVMETHDIDLRVYGDAAVLVSRGISGGSYQGRTFREEERATCVLVRQEGRWRCVLTHLSRMAP